MRVFDNLDAKPDAVRAALATAPTIGESLCDECRVRFAVVRADLDAFGVAYELVPTLVRGLDYYTRTTWEFVGPALGAQSTISGGGRYDGLVEEIGGPPTPGVGFGAGLERLVLALEEAGVAAEPSRIGVFVAAEPDGDVETIRALVSDLRAAGLSADRDYAGRSLKGQLTQAGRLGALTTVIVKGEGATLRRAGEADESLPLDAIVSRLAS